jgi:hypothetical protein
VGERKYPPLLGGYFHTAGIAVPHLIIFSRQLDVSESFPESICKLSWPPLQPEERRRADVAKIAADRNAAERDEARGSSAHRHLQPLATRARARALAAHKERAPILSLSTRLSPLAVQLSGKGNGVTDFSTEKPALLARFRAADNLRLFSSRMYLTPAVAERPAYCSSLSHALPV